MAETLSRFGVPLGGTSGRGGILQPKMTQKFRVRWTNFGPIAGGIELTQQVMTVKFPTFTQSPVEIHSYNSVAYTLGKGSWDECAVEFRTTVDNSLEKLVAYQQQKQFNVLDQTTQLAGINWKFGMFIEVLDGGNDVVLEAWQGEGCQLTNIDWGNGDYSTADIRRISMNIRADNWTILNGLMPDSILGGFIPGTRV